MYKVTEVRVYFDTVENRKSGINESTHVIVDLLPVVNGVIVPFGAMSCDLWGSDFFTKQMQSEIKAEKSNWEPFECEGKSKKGYKTTVIPDGIKILFETLSPKWDNLPMVAGGYRKVDKTGATVMRKGKEIKANCVKFPYWDERGLEALGHDAQLAKTTAHWKATAADTAAALEKLAALVNATKDSDEEK